MTPNKKKMPEFPGGAKAPMPKPAEPPVNQGPPAGPPAGPPVEPPVNAGPPEGAPPAKGGVISEVAAEYGIDPELARGFVQDVFDRLTGAM